MDARHLFYRISPTKDGYYEVCCQIDGLTEVLFESRSVVQVTDELASRQRALLIERSEETEQQLNG